MKKILLLFLTFFVLLFPLKVNALDVNAKAYILVNAETLGVIAGNNYNEKLPMASTTKIMTALILAEHNTPQKTVKVTKEMIAVEGSSMGLLEGDTVSFNDLLYGMLLASGNDAANVTAYVIGGSLEGFAKIMNNKAKEIGLKNTNFVTPSGLDNENHYSTAYDLAVLTAYALKNEAFKKAVSSYKATLFYGNPPYRRTLTNHNKLLVEFDDAIGVKTGFTKKAGRCLVSAAQRDGKQVICVTLNDPQDWEDHTKLLNLGLNSVVNYTPKAQNQISVLSVIGGEKEAVNVNCNFGSVCLLEDEIKKINYKIHYNKNIFAPIYKDQIVGYITYHLNNKVIKSFNITAKETVKAVEISVFDKFLCCLKLLLN